MLWEKSAPLQRPLEILRGLPWYGTWTSALRSRRIYRLSCGVFQLHCNHLLKKWKRTKQILMLSGVPYLNRFAICNVIMGIKRHVIILKFMVHLNRQIRQALMVTGGWNSQISIQSVHEGGKVNPTHRPPLPPGNIPGTHFC